MKPLQIIGGEAFQARRDGWQRDGLLPGLDDDPVYGAFGRAYYPAVFEEGRSDVSFAVGEGERPLLAVLCTRGPKELDYFGVPVRFYPAAHVAEADAQRAVTEAFGHLDRLAAEKGARGLAIRDDASLGTLSPVGKQCLNRGGVAALRLTASCALGDGEAGMRRGLRKSFQSLVNWGKRNLTLTSVGGDNPDRAAFEAYRAFHAAVAGRVTRSNRSWDAMFAWIAAGRGELVLGYLAGGELVTGTLVVDGRSRAYYASGVYDRNRFDQPLGHWPLWVAMLNAAKRRMRVFELGDIPLAGTASEKEVAIGYFKRGFATDIATSVSWRIETTARRGDA